MGRTIYGYCENKGRHKLDTVKVSVTQPTTKEKVWIQYSKNIINPHNKHNASGSYDFTNDIYTLTSETSIYLLCKVIAGKIYTLSYKSNNGFASIRASNYNYGGSWIEYGRSTTTDGKITFTPTTDTVVVQFIDGTANSSTIQKVQIEQGSTATEYEAYVEPEMYVKNDNDVYEELGVLTEGKADVKYKTRGDFAVLIGSKSLTGSIDAGNTYVQTMWNINYPKGFSKENCIVIAFGTKFANDAWAFGDVNVAKVSIGNVSGAVPRSVTLTADNISVQAWNISETEKTLTYKIVLMKHEVLDSEYTLGDVNQDGSITSDDVETINEYLRGNIALTEQQLKAADVIKDGVVDAVDTAQLNKYVNGTIDSLE